MTSPMNPTNRPRAKRSILERRPLALLAIALAVVGLGAACTAVGSTTPAQDPELVRAFADIVQADSDEDFPISGEQATCTAERVAATLSPDQFAWIVEQSEVDRPATEIWLDNEQIDALATAYAECLDVDALDALIDDFVGTDDLQTPLVQCLRQHYDDHEFRVAVLKELVNDDNGTALSPGLAESLPICPDEVREWIVDSEANSNDADAAQLAACLDRLDDNELLDLMDRYPTWEFFNRISNLCLDPGRG